MTYRWCVLFLVCFFPGNLIAQDQPVIRNGNAIAKALSATDSLKKDTLKKDTVVIKNVSGLDAEVDYSADNSTILDNKTKSMHLYGNARVTYQDMELSADYIFFDQVNHIIRATGRPNPRTKRYSGRPIIKTGDQAPAYADSMTYNTETKRAKLHGISTEVEGGYIQAQQSKKNEYDEISLKDARYSTCNLPYGHQHYYIAITKGIITDKQIVTGPAYLVIEGVTFPAIIPFGFFPKVNKRTSGILFPTFGEEAVRGFYIRDLGYYLGLTDYWDAELRASLYSKGSYEGSVLARYRKNYKYDGSVNFRYASTRTGIEGTPQYKPRKDFNLQWSHSKRTESNPGTTFSASVNAGTSSYFSTTAAGGTYDVSQFTRNNMSSSVAYGKVFADGLFNFTSSLSHNQDLTTKDISLTLPNFSLNMSTLNPFDSKNRTGEQKWYQRISMGYSMTGSNLITTKENLLFKKESLGKFTNGIQHNIPLSFSQNVLKYFQFNLGVPYSERWSFQTIRKSYSATRRDSIMIDTVPGFARAYDYNISSGMSTKVYGQVNFKKGRLMALRHTMTPTIGFSYHPDFGQNKYGYFRDLVDSAGKMQRYSIFEGSLYGSPSSGRSGSINFSLDNTIEAKRRSKSDTTNTPEKVPIIQGLSFSGSYNLAADIFKLSIIGFSGRTSLFKQKLGLNFNGEFDPYAIDATGTRINKYLLSTGSPARLTRIGLSTDYSFNSAAAKSRNENLKKEDQNKSNMNPEQVQALSRMSSDPNAFVDFNVPWNISVSYSFNYSKPALQSLITNTLNFYGDFSVTPLWKIQYNSGYDFQSRKISTTQFSIYRDLHCWDLAFSWVPFGTYRSYSVDLKVKASILQDLKLSRRRSYFNNF